MNGERTSGSLMSSPSEPHRLRRAKAPLAANDGNKRLRGTRQRGSPVARGTPKHIPFSSQEGGWMLPDLPQLSASAAASHGGTAAPASSHGASPSGFGIPFSPLAFLLTALAASARSMGKGKSTSQKSPPAEIKDIPVSI